MDATEDTRRDSFDLALDRFITRLGVDASASPDELLEAYPEYADEINLIVQHASADDWAFESADDLPPLPTDLKLDAVADGPRQVAGQPPFPAPTATGGAERSELTDIADGDSSVRSDSIDTADLPRRLGGYELVELIACGGMGAVFRARQLVPVQRTVAVKIIKPDIGGREVVARFATECRSLALMNHPSIATVFDGGSTEDGHPYLVMELVDGDDLTTHCNRAQLSLEQRLNLFTQVCAGIQHAHQKSIVHRDIKPNNILVSTVDGRTIPKVIDFGLAKALTQLEHSQSSHTQLGQILGTLQYMSPEGASLRPEAVDTRSDVFSLGVVLFELLTGTTPLETELSRDIPIDQRLAIVREQEPVRPSDRVRKFRKSAPTLIASRDGQSQNLLQTQGSSFARRLYGDLDAICLKALASDPNDRYESAAALARDVENFLSGRPVTATHATGLYLLSKFAYRYRRTAALVLSVASLLLIATGLSLGWAYRASTAEQVAEDRLADTLLANSAKEAALKQVDSEREIAQNINIFLRQDLLAQASPDEQSNRDITLREVVDRAAERIHDRFEDQPEIKAELLSTIAEVYLDLGEFEKARTHWQNAHQLFCQAVGAKHIRAINANQGWAQTLLNLGEWTAAEAKMLQNLRSLEESRSKYVAQTRSVRNDLAIVLGKLGRSQEANDIYRSLIAEVKADAEPSEKKLGAYLSNLSVNLLEQTRYLEALPLARQALAVADSALGAEHPDTITRRFNLATVLLRLDRTDESLEILEDTIETASRVLGKEHLSTLLGRQVRVELLRVSERVEEAELAARQLIADCDEFLGSTADIARSNSQVLAKILRDAGREEEAISVLRDKADEFIAAYGKLDRRAIRSVGQAARMLNDFRRYSAARELIGSAWQFSSEQLDETPLIDGMVLVRQWASAIKGLDEWHLLHQACSNLLKRVPAEGTSWQLERGWLQYMDGLALRELKQYEDAVDVLTESLATHHELRGAYYHGTQNTQWLLASVLQRLDRHEEAEPILKSLLKYRSEVKGADSSKVIDAIGGLEEVADQRRERGQLVEAIELYEEVIEFCKRELGGRHPQTISIRNHLGMAFRGQNDKLAAEAVYRQASEEAGEGTHANRKELAALLYNWGLTLNDLERWKEAASTWQRTADELAKQYGKDHYRGERARVYAAKALFNDGAVQQARQRLEGIATISGSTPKNKVKSRVDALELLADMAEDSECGEMARRLEQTYHDLTGLKNVDVWQHSEIALHAAELYVRAGQTSQAVSLAQEIVERRSAADANHYRTSNAYRHLGDALLAADDLAGAEESWLESYAILNRAGIPPRIRLRLVTQTVDRLVKLYEQLGRTEALAAWQKTGRELEP